MFLTIEGIDGSGKTTLCGELKQLLPDAFVVKKKEFLRHSPTKIRSKVALLFEEMYGEASKQAARTKDRNLSDILRMAGWFHLIDQHAVEPRLKAGGTVIMDGWYFKFLARFATRNRHEFDLLNRVLVGLSKPSQTFYLDVSPELAAERKPAFTASECGVLDGYDKISTANFISYQRTQKVVLDRLAIENQWRILSPHTANAAQLAADIVQDINVNQF